MYKTLIDGFLKASCVAGMPCKSLACEIMPWISFLASSTTQPSCILRSNRCPASFVSSCSNRCILWRCCCIRSGCAALLELAAPGSEGSSAHVANNSDVRRWSFLFESGFSTLPGGNPCSSFVPSLCSFGFCKGPLVLALSLGLSF